MTLGSRSDFTSCAFRGPDLQACLFFSFSLVSSCSPPPPVLALGCPHLTKIDHFPFPHNDALILWPPAQHHSLQVQCPVAWRMVLHHTLDGLLGATSKSGV